MNQCSIYELMALPSPELLTEVFAQQDIEQFGIKKGDRAYRRRPSLVFVPVETPKGSNGETLCKALDYNPETVLEWWDHKPAAVA